MKVARLDPVQALRRYVGDDVVVTIQPTGVIDLPYPPVAVAGRVSEVTLESTRKREGGRPWSLVVVVFEDRTVLTIPKMGWARVDVARRITILPAGEIRLLVRLVTTVFTADEIRRALGEFDIGDEDGS